MNIKDVVDKHGRTPDKLIAIMLELQEQSQLNYLSEDDIKEISDQMKIRESRVYSIASFYSLLSTKSRGKHIILLCHDVPCYINGAFNLLNELEEKLGIKLGETTADNLFTLEFSSCLGCCDMAPVMQVNETVYENLTSDKLDDILSKLRREA